MSRLFAVLGLIILGGIPSFRTTDVVYKDIYFRDTGQGLVFANQQIELNVDRQTGEWRSWTTTGLT